jgi:tetratricopeptide (TPR) repeat protein
MVGTFDTRDKLAFIGRQQELSELQYLLDRGTRLITVVAPGGYGKSRLVEELLMTLPVREGMERYVVQLAPIGDHRRIPWATADAIGLRLTDAENPEQQLVNFLEGKRAVIYFDNFEHVLQGAPVLSQLLEVEGVQILVTSREPLQLEQEYLYQLKPLPVGGYDGISKPEQYSPAVKLFANRAALADATFVVSSDNVNQVVDVCQALSGVPLAIELTAAWADKFDLARLQDEIKHLLDIKARTEELPERHRSVRASCDWSYSLLDEYQQLAIRCFSVFRGAFSVDAARAIFPIADLDETLAVLHNKSWLALSRSAPGMHYVIHNEAIREYAYQVLLNSADYDIAVKTHCIYFGKLLERECSKLHTDDQLTALANLNAVIEDVYFAVETAVNLMDAELLRPLAEHLHSYLLLEGAAKPCAHYYETICELAAEQGLIEIQAVSEYALGAALRNLGDYEGAKKHSERAKLAAAKAGMPRIAALAEITYADACRIEGDHAAARLRYFAGMEQLRALDDKYGVAIALFGLGRTAETESDFNTARDLILESLYIQRELGSKYGMAHCLNSLGNMAYREGNYDEAREMNQESLKLRRQLGDKRGIAQSLCNLGNVEFSECDYPSAWALYTESLEIRNDIGEKFGIAASLNNMGNVQYCEGNYEEAIRLLHEALALKREIRDNLGCSFSLNNIGNTCIMLKDYSTASRAFQEAAIIARDVGSVECILAPIAMSSSLLAELGKYAPSAVLAAGVRKQYEESGIAQDPMDSGMLQAGEREVHSALSPEELARLQATGEAMSLPALLAFALDNLSALEAELPEG